MSGKKVAVPSPKEATMLPVRLRRCWEMDFDWELIPDKKLRDAIKSTAASLGMPPLALFAGYLIIISFAMSHSEVHVEGTDLVEPVLIWLSICMPTGSGKSSLWSHLTKLVEKARKKCPGDSNCIWLAGDQSFEKLGEMMSENHRKILGLYDEIPMFLSQMNITRGKNLCDSQQVSTFLQLYGSYRWMRKTVLGEANFSMAHTGLTVGGFTQPNVAKGLIEAPANIEKGVCQRFLWVFPKPTPTKLKDLNPIDETFTAKIVNLIEAQWKPNEDVQRWTLPKDNKIYQTKYDEIIDNLERLSYDDILLSGMLSKSKMQILRIGAVIHVLFHYDKPHDVPSIISCDAIKSSVKFVDTCIQHVLFVLGRKDIKDEIDEIQQKLQKNLREEETTVEIQAKLSASLSLTLPGNVLYMSALSYLKKFKNCGNKSGGLLGWRKLETDDLGEVQERKAVRGTDKIYEFKKRPVPSVQTEKEEFALKLMEYQVTIQQYDNAFNLDNITMETIQARKSGTPKKRNAAVEGDPGSSAKKQCL